MSTPTPAGIPDPATHPRPPPEGEEGDKERDDPTASQESASDADAGDA